MARLGLGRECEQKTRYGAAQNNDLDHPIEHIAYITKSTHLTRLGL